MPHRVVLAHDVEIEVASFTKSVRHYWDISIAEIARDPSERWGVCTERLVPFLPFPRRRRFFEITTETSISGELMFVFVADFLPGSIVFVTKPYSDPSRHVSGLEGEAKVISIRPHQKRAPRAASR